MERILGFTEKHQQVLKYAVAGGFVFVLNLALLYFFTDLLHIYYILSTVLAFLIAFCTSFLLQKFWTFRDHSLEHIHIQVPLFLGMQLANISINTALMYVFVEYLHIWYLLSQGIISLGLAVGIFFINKKYIFKARGALIQNLDQFQVEGVEVK